jgi:hypothetical protein
MKYLVTAPPGALGHFLSRILNNEYDFTVGHAGQYHALKKTYSSQTTVMEQYNGLTMVDDKVICLHNFDNCDFSELAPDRRIINIVVDGCWEIFLNNYYRKAIQSNVDVANNYHQQVNKKFPTSKNSLREEFYWLYLNACKGNIEWLPTDMAGISINFCDFYQLSSFKTALDLIPGLETHNPDEIWSHFMQSQQPIISRTHCYHQICQDIKNNTTPTIPDYFDNVDFGIMCGMLYICTGQDLLNLDQDSWI